MMINRRVLLSGLALLPALFSSARAIAQTQPATGSSLDSGKEGHARQLVEDAVRTYRQGTDTTPTPIPLITLQPSGSITVTADNQVIENKLITGSINLRGRNGVIIRNCHVRHPGGMGIYAQSCTNLTIEDCKVVNTSAPVGLKPNPDESKNIELNYGGPHTIRRVYVEGACGIYAYRCAGALNISFLEGHNIRGPLSVPRGQLIQMNQCSGGALMEDFSAESDVKNSWTEDLVNLFQCTGGPYIIRRGMIDGNNGPAGCAYMVEGTSNVLFEDVDCVRQGNGAFEVYAGGPSGSASTNVIYRRARVRDTIQQEVGRGKIASNYCSFISSPGCIGTRFEQNKYYDVNESNLAWDGSTMAVRDWVKQDFTPRVPIRNKFRWNP